jgi:hypothetical protein
MKPVYARTAEATDGIFLYKVTCFRLSFGVITRSGWRRLRLRGDPRLDFVILLNPGNLL